MWAFWVNFEEFVLLESGSLKQTLQLSPNVDLEGDDVKGILDARVLGNLMCFIVCVESNLANMTRLVVVIISDPEKEHLKAVKWVKSTLSCDLLHR